MGAKDAKQFVYRYNGDVKSEEVEQDLDGEIVVPQKDQVIVRNGKRLKIVHVNIQSSLSKSGPIPVVRVFLTEQP
jgi:hypothetical protein